MADSVAAHPDKRSAILLTASWASVLVSVLAGIAAGGYWLVVTQAEIRRDQAGARRDLIEQTRRIDRLEDSVIAQQASQAAVQVDLARVIAQNDSIIDDVKRLIQLSDERAREERQGYRGGRP